MHELQGDYIGSTMKTSTRQNCTLKVIKLPNGKIVRNIRKGKNKVGEVKDESIVNWSYMWLETKTRITETLKSVF